MGLPGGFYVDGRIDWVNGHGDPHQAAKDIAEALEGSGTTVVYDEQRGEHLILAEKEDD